MKLQIVALTLVSLLILPYVALGATYQIDAVHSSVEFSIRHLVAKTSGRFTDFSGTVEFDEEHPEKGAVTAVINVASIDTANEKRDEHLRSADFFDAEKYPEITFEGKAAEQTDSGFNVAGVLTMHGVSKEIVMPVELLGVGAGVRGEQRVGFYAELRLNRKDFGIVWNKVLDHGGTILGDEVQIRLSIEAMAAPGQAQK